MTYQKADFITYTDRQTGKSIEAEFYNAAAYRGQTVVNIVLSYTVNREPDRLDTIFLNIGYEHFQKLLAQSNAKGEKALDVQEWQLKAA